jgi:hypothetical protein
MSHFSLIAGYRAYHVKTSPQGDEHFVGTLSGAFGWIALLLGRKRG